MRCEFTIGFPCTQHALFICRPALTNGKGRQELLGCIDCAHECRRYGGEIVAIGAPDVELVADAVAGIWSHQ